MIARRWIGTIRVRTLLNRWLALSIAVLAAPMAMRDTVVAGDRPKPDGSVIGERFRQLTRSAPWRPVGEVKLDFRTHHPQGMSLVGDRFFLSSVETVDRARGVGVGHLFEVDFEGRLRRRIRLGEGAMYHPGGIDFDGRWLWVPVAEYRPDSRSVVYRVDPNTLAAERTFDFDDHLGALVCDRVGRRLVGVSWGSRRLYRWQLNSEGDAPKDPAVPVRSENGGHYVDFQDGQFLPGTSCALFGGVSRLRGGKGIDVALGGLELVDLETLRAVHQVPVPLWSDRGQSLLRNPMAVRVVPEGLRWYFIPEDDASTLHVYATD